MDTIAFYISNQGLMHVTRCLALIEEMVQTTTNHIYIASGESQNRFAKRYLDKYLSKYSNRISYSSIKTDVGLMGQKNSASVDISQLENELKEYISELPSLVDSELEKLKYKNPVLVISDISILGVLVAEELGIRKIGLSNFTWCNYYENLNMDQQILQVFYDAYNKLDCFLAYDLTLDLSYLKCEIQKIGLACRKIDNKSVDEIKKHNWPSVYIGNQLSPKLKQTNMHFDRSVSRLSVNILDTQNHVAASELVVVRADWVTLSEALISKTPMVVIEGDVEEEPIINILKEKNLCLTIQESELYNLDILELQIKLQKLETSKYENNVGTIVNEIYGYLEESQHQICL